MNDSHFKKLQKSLIAHIKQHGLQAQIKVKLIAYASCREDVRYYFQTVSLNKYRLDPVYFGSFLNQNLVVKLLHLWLETFWLDSKYEIDNYWQTPYNQSYLIDNYSKVNPYLIKEFTKHAKVMEAEIQAKIAEKQEQLNIINCNSALKSLEYCEIDPQDLEVVLEFQEKFKSFKAHTGSLINLLRQILEQAPLSKLDREYILKTYLAKQIINL